MEDYVNNNTIIKNEFYNIFKESVTCPLCNSIYIDPVICMNCQKVYCKKCIDKWSNDNKSCPNNCVEAKYQNCIGKNEILSKLSFKCNKCQKEIKYDEAKNHKDSCSPGKILIEEPTPTTPTQSTPTPTPSGMITMEKISNEQMSVFRNQGKEVIYINGKFIY